MTSDNLFMIPEPKLLNPVGEFKLDEETLKGLAEETARRQMQEEAMRQMAESQERPDEQTYIYRLDNKTLVKTDEEYAWCLANSVPLRFVGYRHALQILAETEARQRDKIAKRHARKRAKASRKRNRT